MDTTKIDAALSEAKARRNARKGDDAEKAPSQKMTAEERAARDEARAQERAAKKAARDQAREAKRAERDAGRKPAHMLKVEKAASKLPGLGDDAQALFNSATVSLTAEQVVALASHLNHFNRVKATTRALAQKLAEGDQVRIVSGDQRYIGQEGRVVKAQRIRCYVEVPTAKKPVYCFTSDVELVKAAAKTGTEG